MPQMSPMYWLTLMFYFIFMLILMILMIMFIYFTFFMKPKYCSDKLSMNSMTWSW